MNRSLSSCMKEHGFSVESEHDLFEKILGPEQKIFTDSLTSGAASGEGSDQLGVTGGAFSPPTIAAAQREALRVLELNVANADADCRSHKDLDKLSAIRRKYEAAFIEENRSSFEQLKAAQNG